MEIPQQFGSSQDSFVLPFEKFKFRKYCQDGFWTICWIFLIIVWLPLHFVFNICSKLLSTVIMNFGFEITYLGVSQITLLVFGQVKMNANDAWSKTKVKI